MMELNKPGERRESSFSNDVFCQIIEGKLPASLIAETEFAISFMALEGHPLVVPKKHIDEGNLLESSDDLAKTMELVTKLIPSVKAVYKAEGISIYMAVGKAAGQEVRHLHFHLFPRQTGDRVVRFIPLEKVEREALNDLAKKISKKFADG